MFGYKIFGRLSHLSSTKTNSVCRLLGKLMFLSPTTPGPFQGKNKAGEKVFFFGTSIGESRRGKEVYETQLDKVLAMLGRMCAGEFVQMVVGAWDEGGSL